MKLLMTKVKVLNKNKWDSIIHLTDWVYQTFCEADRQKRVGRAFQEAQIRRVLRGPFAWFPSIGGSISRLRCHGDGMVERPPVRLLCFIRRAWAACATGWILWRITSLAMTYFRRRVHEWQSLGVGSHYETCYIGVYFSSFRARFEWGKKPGWIRCTITKVDKWMNEVDKWDMYQSSFTSDLVYLSSSVNTKVCALQYVQCLVLHLMIWEVTNLDEYKFS